MNVPRAASLLPNKALSPLTNRTLNEIKWRSQEISFYSVTFFVFLEFGFVIDKQIDELSNGLTLENFVDSRAQGEMFEISNWLK